MATDPQKDRRINLHTSPDVMAGHYANFANVSHSEYEFTITFARVDHEVEGEEIPGVVVSRVSLSPKFLRELLDAMEDNYSKWRTREGIKSLPEWQGDERPPGPPTA
jgi:hemerythrin-like domain-containing protein